MKTIGDGANRSRRIAFRQVYLDDNPQAPVEPVIEALAAERARGRSHAFGFRNWRAERIQAALSCMAKKRFLAAQPSSRQSWP
jgi:aryl-alcohol dehydrogenase-like predicted oxidoreductase